MEYIPGKGIYYKTAIEVVKKKSGERLRPIFEAITNSWEALLQKYGEEGLGSGKISVIFHVVKQLAIEAKDAVFNFRSIEVIDNGQGLTPDNYNRVIDLRDDRKGFHNKGTGRVQFLHFFEKTYIDSVFACEDNVHTRIMLVLSKSKEFIDDHNAFVRKDICEEVGADVPITTKVTFENPLDKKDAEFYANISAGELKKQLIRHFLTKLCDAKGHLPQMTVVRSVLDNDDEKSERLSILSDDVPSPANNENITVNYSKLGDNNTIATSEKTERFRMRSFVLPAHELEKNEISLVSKGETAESFSLDDLQPDEIINGNRYMVLLSGEYIDKSDSDTRGNLSILTAKEFKKIHKDAQDDLFGSEVVLLDDIKNRVNTRMRELHGEIGTKAQEREENVDRLRKMFLLNEETVNVIRSKVKNTDTDESILKRVYEADSQIKARQDAELKKEWDSINAMLPTDENYMEELNKKAENLVLKVPLQNRTALAQYVARRKIVLSIFQKILDKSLERLENKDRIDEKVLHNLVFQQSSDNPEDSDLWLINEEFIYFKGVSEFDLKDVTFNGRKIFDKDFSEEETKYLNSNGERRLLKRPDILLFPEEGKCIIIEFKAPDVNVALHLNQIHFYANLLHNYTAEEFNFTRYYGFLIGEAIEDRDVRGYASDYKVAPQFGYWYCPSQSVTSFCKKPDGDLYSEVLKYSSLLERAKARNEIFIKKLGLAENTIKGEGDK